MRTHALGKYAVPPGLTPTATEKVFLVIVMITSHAQGDAHT